MEDKVERDISRIVYFIDRGIDIINRKSAIFNRIKLGDAENIDIKYIKKNQIKKEENSHRRDMNRGIIPELQLYYLPVTEITAKNSEISNTVICCDDTAQAIILHISYLLIEALNTNERFFQKVIEKDSQLITLAINSNPKENIANALFETIVTSVLYCYYGIVLNEQSGADITRKDLFNNVPQKEVAIFLTDNLSGGDIELGTLNSRGIT